MKFLILSAVLVFAGCASVRTDNANPTLQTPILTKSERRGFNLELGSSDRIKFTEDASLRPPVLNNVYSRTNDLRANFAYGINEWMDVSIGATSNPGLNLTSRVHLMGDDKSTWLAAGTFFASYDKKYESGDQKGNFGPGGYNWNATTSAVLGSVGVSVGYRFSENMLLIFNGGVGKTTAKLDIQQDAANGDPGGNYSTTLEAPLTNAGFGLTFGQRTLYTVGFMYTHKEWKDNNLGDTSTTHTVIKIEMD